MTTTEKLAEKLEEFLAELIQDELGGDSNGVHLQLWIHDNNGRIQVTEHTIRHSFTTGEGFGLKAGRTDVYVVPALGEKIIPNE